MRRSRIGLVTFAALLFGLVAAAAGFEDQEQESRLLSDRWNIGLGGYLVDFNTSVQIGSGTVIGTFIRLESDLGLERYRNTFLLDGFYRFTPRKTIAFGYYAFDRSSSTVVDERLEIGDEEGNTVIYDVGALIDTGIGNTLFQLTYRYSFINNGKVEAGVGGGLGTYEYDVKLEGAGTVIKNDGEEEQVEGATAGTDFIAPIPTVAIFVHYAITPRLIFRTSFNYLDVSIDRYSGNILDTRITFDYFFSRHVGIGGGMSATSLEVASDDEVNPWQVEYGYSGFVVYLGLVF